MLWSDPVARETYKTLVLERLQVYSTQVTSSYVMRHVALDVRADLVAEGLFHALYSHVLAERLEVQTGAVTFDAWASWWQHTKDALFPTFSRWMRRPPRGVVVSKGVKVDHFATFPECRNDYPAELGRPVLLSIARPLSAV